MNKVTDLLNEDLFNIIYQLVPIIDRKDFALVSRFFNNLYQQDLNDIKKIQRFYKNNKIDEDYLNDAGLNKYKNSWIQPDYNDWNKFLVYRYYIAKYDIQYLLSYPEFLTNKAIMDPEKKENAFNWINNNLNSDPENRSRRDIYNFFKENNITSQEIMVAGL